MELESQQLDQTSTSKSWPKSNFKNLIKLQPQKLNQTLASKSWPKISIKIFTKIQLQNLASKYWQKIKIYFKILTKLRLQYLYQTSASISWTIFSVKISSKLLPTSSSSSTSAIVRTSTSVQFASSGSHQSISLNNISQSVSDKGRQWSDLGLIKTSSTSPSS